MIKKLNSKLINQIAAGEVVDNPKSIIKELLENSIDAKSTNIEIFIDKAGIEKIIIIDDGIGISHDELPIAFERFATSKITNIDDLNNVETLGFRGEALPSIASVSNLRIDSKSKTSSDSYSLSVKFGTIGNIQPSNIEGGTKIEIKNLFYNVPARKKFLKSEQSEYRKILKLFKRIALSNYKVSFKLFHNNKLIYSLPVESLENRIGSLFGKDIADACLMVDYEKDKYRITGYIGNLSIVKPRRGNQYLFINNRSIDSQFVNISIYNAYRSLIQRGEFPFFVLNISVPGTYIDVNVHPKKEEVKFKNEMQIQHVMKKAISEKLHHFLSMIPNFSNYSSNNDTAEPIDIPFEGKNVLQPNLLTVTNSNHDYSNEIKNAEIRLSKDPVDDSKTIIDSKNIWQIHNKYIVTEITSGLIIIDQHVAHERVLYENAKKAIEGKGLKSQSILFPQTLEFENEEFTYLPDIMTYLEKIGFKLREFGESSIIIEGVPGELPYGREKEVIQDILDHYIKTKSINSSFIEYIAATYACKAAIKAGDKLNSEECIELIDLLFSTEHPYYCPHGRPIIINLTLDDLDKRFERH